MLQVSLAGGPASAGSEGASSAACSQLEAAVGKLCAHLAEDLRDSTGAPLLTGPALNAAGAFASEDAYWLALCLQVG